MMSGDEEDEKRRDMRRSERSGDDPKTISSRENAHYIEEPRNSRNISSKVGHRT
jgi:hypothetical protein